MNYKLRKKIETVPCFVQEPNAHGCQAIMIIHMDYVKEQSYKDVKTPVLYRIE